MRTRVLVAIGLVVGAGCGADAPRQDASSSTVTGIDDGGSSSSVTNSDSSADSSVGASVDDTVTGTGDRAIHDPSLATEALTVIHLPDAISVNVATNGTSEPVVAWTERESVQVARLDVDSFALGSPVDVSGDLVPIAHPIERPAISIGPDGVVHTAFTSFVESKGTVHYVDLVGDEPTTLIQISGDPQPETNLVHMTAADNAPTLAWLEDSTLSVAPQRNGRPFEIEQVDDLTCDCCNPVPIRLDDRLAIAYRNLERSGDGTIRDVVVTTTDDDGDSFAEPVLVADGHWYLEGCPFSGPSVAQVDDTLVVAWMDGRQSLHPDQDSTTIWVDRSADRGATFGEDLAITDDGEIHRWPVVAIDAGGTTHLIWETQTGDSAGISYSRSDDAGATFTAATSLVSNTAESGARRTPSVIVHGEQLIVSWLGREGGHVVVFPIANLPH